MPDCIAIAKKRHPGLHDKGEAAKEATLLFYYAMASELPSACHLCACPFRVAFQPTDAPAFARLIPRAKMRCSRSG
jgi:hypothetical protein